MKEEEIGAILCEELVWVEKKYEEDPMDCWINRYRNALRTVLRRVARGEVEKKMKEEDKHATGGASSYSLPSCL